MKSACQWKYVTGIVNGLLQTTKITGNAQKI